MDSGVFDCREDTGYLVLLARGHTQRDIHMEDGRITKARRANIQLEEECERVEGKESARAYDCYERHHHRLGYHPSRPRVCRL
jgi:hypothetical protein